MCGIVGMLAKRRKAFTYPDFDIFKDMLVCDAVRGEDSTGVFSVNDVGNAHWVKLAAKPHNLLETSEYKELQITAYNQGRAVIGHNRKATQGGVINKNAHPFVFGNTVLVHNGGIDNYRSLLPIREREKYQVEVDSHAMAILFARNNPEDIIKEIKGAFVFVWYDVLTKKLHFVRNDERPLFFANSDHKAFFASEGSMMSWLLGRRNIKTTVTSLKPSILLTFGLDKDELYWEHKEIKLREEKFYSLPSSSLPHQEPQSSQLSTGVRRLFRRNASLEEIPEAERFNIHYGRDILVDSDEVPHQQIVFTIDDYKPIDPKETNPRKWILWGNALDSDIMHVIYHMNGSEKDVEAIAYSNHLIGFIRDSKIKRNKNNTIWIQEIFVSDVRSVDMTTSVNGTPITEDHMKYILNNGVCRCNAVCSEICQQGDLHITTEGPKIDIQCEWCHNHEKEVEANEAVKNPAV